MRFELLKAVSSATVLAVALFSPCGAAQEADEEAFVAEPTPDALSGPYVSLPIPRRVLRADIARWSEMLVLSDKQAAYLRSLHEAYLSADRELRQELFTPLWEWSKSLGPVQGQSMTDVAIAEDLEALFDSLQDAVKEVLRDEAAALFGQLSAVLAEEQVGELRRVRNDRMRTVYQTVGTAYPGANVALTAILTGMRDECIPSDKASFDATLRAYDQSLTMAMRRHYERKWEMMARASIFNARSLGGESPAVFRARFLRLLGRTVDAEESIVQLNELYLPLLQATLTDDSAQTLEYLYQKSAHPLVFPDPFDLRRVFRAVTDRQDLTEKQHEAIQSLSELHEFRQDAVAQRMIDEITSWIAPLLRTYQANMTELGDHKKRLDEMHKQRRAGTEETITMLRDILTDEQRAAIEPRIDDVWKDASRFQPRDLGMQYSPAYRPEQ